MEFLQHYDDTSQKEVRYKKKKYDKARTLERSKSSKLRNTLILLTRFF